MMTTEGYRPTKAGIVFKFTGIVVESLNSFVPISMQPVSLPRMGSTQHSTCFATYLISLSPIDGQALIDGFYGI